MKAVIGIKKGMTRIFDGKVSVPVTLVDISDSKVVRVSGDEVELGCGKEKNPNKPLLGKYKELGYVPGFRRTFTKLDGEYKVGDDLDLSFLTEKSGKLKITGVSKGKGFQGVMKRWGFRGGDRTHGQSDRQRHPGSIGAGTDPGRVWPGKKMAGRMGGDKITYEGGKVIKVTESGIVAVKGQVPGNVGSLITIYVD